MSTRPPPPPRPRSARTPPPRTCERLGFAIVARNHRTRFGELDLVACDGDALVFVEVKTRRAAAAVAPWERAARRRKQAAGPRAWRARSSREHAGPPARRAELRFDAIGVIVDARGTRCVAPRAPRGRVRRGRRRACGATARAAGTPATGRTCGAAARRRGARSRRGARASSSRRGWRTPSPVQRVGAVHEAVARDLRDDRGGGDRRAGRVAVDDRALLVAEVRHREAVDEAHAAGHARRRAARRAARRGWSCAGRARRCRARSARRRRPCARAQHERVELLARLGVCCLESLSALSARSSRGSSAS